MLRSENRDEMMESRFEIDFWRPALKGPPYRGDVFVWLAVKGMQASY